MDDVLALQVVQRQRHLTQVESDSLFTELDTLLQVVAQISAQQEVHHHEHVLFVLEGVPGVKERSHCSLSTQWGWKAEVQTETDTNRHHLQAAASMQQEQPAGTVSRNSQQEQPQWSWSQLTSGEHSIFCICHRLPEAEHAGRSTPAVTPRTITDWTEFPDNRKSLLKEKIPRSPNQRLENSHINDHHKHP